MKCSQNPEGGMRLELEPQEVAVFRHLVERASFIDTLPADQTAIFQMAEQILAELGRS